MTFDPKDGYVVLFGGFSSCGTLLLNDTWKFVGGNWTNISGSHAPLARFWASMTYDAKDGYALLFGGASDDFGGKLNDTWKFVGGAWTQLTLSTAPQERYGAAMTYDAKDGYVVLFGGSRTFVGDTWKFVAGSWTRLAPGNSPSGSLGASMAYDAKDGYVVIFRGSCSNSGVCPYTWKFLRGNWSNITGTSAPPWREFATMAYDASDGYVVLSGGANTSGVLADTWKFVGGAWSRITPLTFPSARESSSMTYDGTDGHILLFSGRNHSGTGPLGDTWGFAGGAWTHIQTKIHPPERFGASMTFDAKDSYVVLFGGCGCNEPRADTWTFEHSTWRHLKPATSPSARDDASMTYDAADGYVVLFGGFERVSPYPVNDTWKFLNGTWTQLSPGVSPPAREGAPMAFDVRDNYVILFGGEGGSGLLGDTWKFTAGKWSQLAPGTSPSARFGATMAFDAKDAHIVLFGGDSASGLRGDTWNFTGGVWKNITRPGAPPSRELASMVFDAKDGYLVLFGGFAVNRTTGRSISVNDTWTFAGGTWTHVAVTTFPSARGWSSSACDGTDGYTVLFGGTQNFQGQIGLPDTWKFLGGNWTKLSG